MSDLISMNDEELSASLSEDVVESIPETPDDFEDLSIEEQTSLPPTEQSKPAEVAQATTPEPEKPALTLDSLQEQLSKMEARLKEKETFIGRQANMIGDLKKQSSALPQPKAEMPTDEEFMTQPVEALRKFEAARKAETEKQAALQAEEFNLVTTRNKEITASFVPEFDNLMTDIEKVLIEEDGLSSDLLAPFKNNPYATPLEVLIQLAKRVQQRTQITALKSEVDSLKAENEKLKGKSSKILNNIENSARQTTQVRPSTSPAGNSVAPGQLAALSYEEILAQLNE